MNHGRSYKQNHGVHPQKKTENFSYMDQQMMYDEIAGKLTDMSLDALKNEYLNNMEGTENE